MLESMLSCILYYATVKWLARWPLDGAVQVRVPPGLSVLPNTLTLTVPLFTQEHKWLPSICWGDLTDRLAESTTVDYNPFQGRGGRSRHTLICFALKEPEARCGSKGRHGTSDHQKTIFHNTVHILDTLLENYSARGGSHHTVENN